LSHLKLIIKTVNNYNKQTYDTYLNLQTLL